MKALDPSTLFAPWLGRALYDDELAAVARADKAASFMCPLWKHPHDPKALRHLPELDALDLGLSVSWCLNRPMDPTARVVAARLSELWRIPAHQALYDALELARCGWDHGCIALESRLFGYTDAQTRRYLETDVLPYRAAYFVVDDASARRLRRVRGRYLDSTIAITLFAPTHGAKPRGDARRRVAPLHLARGELDHTWWAKDFRRLANVVAASKGMWTATIDADTFNAALDGRIEVLGAKGWRCD